MRNTFRAFTAILAISTALVGASVVPSFAQTTTMETPAKPKAVPHRRHLLHPGIGSASSRNVGPSSTVGGTSAAVGNPGSTIVPGAPAAGSVTGGGGK